MDYSFDELDNLEFQKTEAYDDFQMPNFQKNKKEFSLYNVIF